MEEPNLVYIHKISKGDKDFEEMMINTVYEDLMVEIDNYNQFFKDNDLNKMKENVHRIKHKMSILGLKKSYELTNTYENNLREGSMQNREYFENMLPIMIKFLEDLKIK